MIVKIVFKKENETIMLEGNAIGYRAHSSIPSMEYTRINSPSLSELKEKPCLVLFLDDTPIAVYDSMVYIINKEGKTIDKIII